jgi:hypothetical protein
MADWRYPREVRDGDLEETVRRLLRAAPAEPLCAACLALACETTLIEMRQRIEALLEDRQHFQPEAACASCRRTVPAILYHRAA